MTVVWAPPENDGGKSITGYILERKEKRAVRWVPCTKSPISERRMKVTNLIPNHEYQFRVKAENEVGLGEPSKPCRPVAAKDPIGECSVAFSGYSASTFSKCVPRSANKHSFKCHSLTCAPLVVFQYLQYLFYSYYLQNHLVPLLA